MLGSGASDPLFASGNACFQRQSGSSLPARAAFPSPERPSLVEPMFGAWVVDYFLALGFGIVFQYFTIAPMRDLSLGQGLFAAAKADSFPSSSGRSGCTAGWRSRPSSSSATRSRKPTRFSVHDADRDAGRVHDQLSGELVVAPRRDQGKDVASSCASSSVDVAARLGSVD